MGLIKNPLTNPAVKAICFLKEDGDLRNCAYFTEELLTIIIKGRSHQTAMDQVKRLSLGTRKMLGPIVSGGIVFPLSMVAIFGDFGNSFFMMMIAIASLLLFMYGFGGSPAITINTPAGTHHYFIPRSGHNIEKFIKYFNSKEYLEEEV